MMIILTTDQFSAHYYERFQYNLDFDTGWALCHISVVFFQIPFKPQKDTPTMVTSPTCLVSSNYVQWFTL